jgi:hypothetical protein
MRVIDISRITLTKQVEKLWIASHSLSIVIHETRRTYKCVTSNIWMWHTRKSKATYTREPHKRVMSQVMVAEHVQQIACVTHMKKGMSKITVTEQIEIPFVATHSLSLRGRVTHMKESCHIRWRSSSRSHSLLLIHSLFESFHTYEESCYSFFFFRAMNGSRCTKHAAVLYNSKWAELDFTTGNRAQESYLQCSELQCGVHVVQCGVHVVQCGAVHALVDSIELQFNWIGFYYRESSTRRYWATSTCSATVMCHTTHSGVWHDSFAWLICICNMTHLCVRRDWNLRAIKLFHVSDDRAHVCVRHEWFMCAKWLVCTISTRSAQ